MWHLPSRADHAAHAVTAFLMWQELDVEPLLLVEPLFERHVIARELRLGDPLQLQPALLDVKNHTLICTLSVKHAFSCTLLVIRGLYSKKINTIEIKNESAKLCNLFHLLKHPVSLKT